MLSIGVDVPYIVDEIHHSRQHAKNQESESRGPDGYRV
jgi:hypothetical protein